MYHEVKEMLKIVLFYCLLGALFVKKKKALQSVVVGVHILDFYQNR